jgi:hypothetical protein
MVARGTHRGQVPRLGLDRTVGLQTVLQASIHLQVVPKVHMDLLHPLPHMQLHLAMCPMARLGLLLSDNILILVMEAGPLGPQGRHHILLEDMEHNLGPLCIAQAQGHILLLTVLRDPTPACPLLVVSTLHLSKQHQCIRASRLLQVTTSNRHNSSSRVKAVRSSESGVSASLRKAARLAHRCVASLLSVATPPCLNAWNIVVL